MKEIGEIFKYENVELLVVEGDNDHCGDCFFKINSGCTRKSYGDEKLYLPCVSYRRTDRKAVIYKQINQFKFGK